MARNDAKDVERQYYEFKRRMEQKRASAPAPVKKTNASVRKASDRKVDKPVSIQTPAEKKPPISEAAPAETSEKIVAQSLPDGDCRPLVAEMPEDFEASNAAEFSEEKKEETGGEELDVSYESEEEDYVDEDETATDDEDEENEEEDGENSSVMGVVREVGSALVKRLSGISSSVGEKIRSLRRGKVDEEETYEEESFDEAVYEEAPTDGVIDESAEAAAEVENQPQEADTEEPTDVVETSESAEVPDVFEEDAAFDENVDPDFDSDEDDEDDEESSGFFSRITEGIRGRFSRSADADEEDKTDEEDGEEEDEAPGLFARLKQRRSVGGEAEEEDGDEHVDSVDSADSEKREMVENVENIEESVDVAANESTALDDDGEDEYEDLLQEGDDFENLYEPASANRQTETSAQETIQEEVPNSNTNDQEGECTPMENNTDNRKSMSELMSEGLNDTPTLSRRERRMLAEAASKRPVAKLGSELEALEEADMNEEPTQKYTPVRARADESAVKPALKRPVVALDDDEDEDDEEEIRPARKPFGKKKAPVYDEDDDDDDDYDDEDDDEEEISFSKRLYGFLKYLLAIVIILALVVLGLRVCEGAGYISLDSVRSVFGNVPFVQNLFPAPEATDELKPEPTDLVHEGSAMPTDLFGATSAVVEETDTPDT